MPEATKNNYNTKKHYRKSRSRAKNLPELNQRKLVELLLRGQKTKDHSAPINPISLTRISLKPLKSIMLPKNKMANEEKKAIKIFVAKLIPTRISKTPDT